MRGKRGTAHARSAGSRSSRRCATASTSSTTPASPTSETLDMLEAAKDRVFVAPGIAILLRDAQRGRALGHHAREGGARWATSTSGTRPLESLRAMHKRGIRVLPGGDYGFALTPHGQNARDLEYFVKYLGFTPMEAIRSATLLRRPDHDEGRRARRRSRTAILADLLLVDGDPLANLAILRDPKRILAVMKDGVFAQGARDRAPQRRWERAA